MQMKTKPAAMSRQAFTLTEVLVVLAVLAVLMGSALPALMRAKLKAERISCVGNLKNIGLAFRIFATDNTNTFPFQLSTNQGGTLEWTRVPSQAWRHFVAISNELSIPRIVHCYSDRERRAVARDWLRFTNNESLSYFLGIHAAESQPQSLLAGDRNLQLDGVALTNQIVTFSTNANVVFDGRIHRFAGNALLCDGSVQQLSSDRLRDQFRDAALVTTNTLIIP